MLKDPRNPAASSFVSVWALLSISLSCLSLFAVSILHTVSTSQQLHLQSFVPAKRLTSGFEREMLNARISFIYFVTIQKPGTLEKGWQRYHNAENRLADLATLVDQQAELSNLKAPVLKLQTDVANYSDALSATLALVQSGERSGPHYDRQVAEWAARGAVTVADAASVESLCFNSGEANTARTVSLVKRGERVLLETLCLCLLLGTALTLWLLRKIQASAVTSGAGDLNADVAAEPAHAVPHELQKQW